MSKENENSVIRDEMEAPLVAVEECQYCSSVPEPEEFDPANSNLVKHAEHELSFLKDSDDEMDNMAYNNVIELTKTFAAQGHSGFSAPYVINLFKIVGNYDIIGELTGEDDEWVETSSYGSVHDILFQNKRDSRVFKDKNGAYQISAYIFENPLWKGSFYTNCKSIHQIKKFPYRPFSVNVKARFYHKLWAKFKKILSID